MDGNFQLELNQEIQSIPEKIRGRIDKRLIAELGFGNANVFSQTFVDSYPDAFLHISVDASGSMSGSKWYKNYEVS